MAEPLHVSFICSGNMCRSPFAEAYLRQTAKKEYWIDLIRVSSAGTLGIIGSPAHTTTIALSAEYGLNLLEHRSQAASSEYLKGCDVVLGMSSEHVAELRKANPDLAERIYLFGNYPDSSLEGPEIPDPVCKEEEEFRKCHTAIAQAIEPIIQELRTLLGVEA